MGLHKQKTQIKEISQGKPKELKPGQKVNVETDIIGKYVAKFMAANRDRPLTFETLKEQGFA